MALFRNKRMVSGAVSSDMIDTFKQQLFDKWCMEATTKGSTIKYKPYAMPEHYIPFPIWELWISIGPPAGDACNPILKAEFIAPTPVSFAAANGADTTAVPEAIAALNAGAQGARFISRSAMSKPPASRPLFSSPKGVSPTSHNSVQSEREERKQINDRIKQLEWLSRSEFCSVD